MIYSILNNDNINYIHFILWYSENAMSRQQPMYVHYSVMYYSNSVIYYNNCFGFSTVTI